MIFLNDKQLAIQLISWFENFPNNNAQCELDKKFRKELHKFQKNRWHGNWISIVLPYFNQQFMAC